MIAAIVPGIEIDALKLFRILKQLVGGAVALFLLWRAWDSFATGELILAGIYGVGVIAVALFTLDA